MKQISLLLCVLLAAAAPALAHADLADSLLASLPLREDLQDHSPSKLPVTVVGNILVRDGAAYFPGDGNWLELPYLPLDHRPFAVSLWVRPTGSAPTYGLLEQKDRDETGHLLHFVMREGLHPWLGFYINDTVSPIGLSNARGWQHLVFQYADGSQEIWINGRLICRRAADAYQGTGGVTAIGRMERWTNVPGHDFQGYLSDLRIYMRALSAKEVHQLAHAAPAGTLTSDETKDLAATGQMPDATAGIPLLKVNGGAMRVHGLPGTVYTVDASSDLRQWQSLGAVAVGDDGYVDVVDGDAARFPQRYYRMRYGASR